MKKLFYSLAFIAGVLATSSPVQSSTISQDCISTAAAYHGVSEAVLRAIGMHESYNRPDMVQLNKNKSEDLGAFGINTVHLGSLAQYGIGRRELMNGCTNAFVAAWLYGQKIRKHGNTWIAVGAYHSETPDKRDLYAYKISKLILGSRTR